MVPPILLTFLMNHPTKIARVRAPKKDNMQYEISAVVADVFESRAFKSPRADAKTITTKKVIPPATVARTYGKNFPPKKVEITPNAIKIDPMIHGLLVRNSTMAVA